MLALFRRFLNTWAARGFFVVLVAAFGLWGVADVVRNMGGDSSTAVATVGGRPVDVSELQDASRRMLAEFMQRNPGQTPTPEVRQGATQQALRQLIVQAAFAGAVDRMGLAVPDAALRDETFQNHAFQNASGQFDRATFDSVLQSNGYTEQRYMALLHTDIGQRQLVEAIRAGGTVPDLLTKRVYTFENEKRSIDYVNLPFAAAAQPPEPTPDQLERQYDDNMTDYTTPAMRRIKAVILSPESVSKDVTVSDDDLHAYYDQHKSEFAKPETRSVQVIGAPDQGAATKLADAWKAGATWDAMQKQATAAYASAVALDNTEQSGLPVPDLAQQIFSASANTVMGPVKSDFGWQVFRVTQISPAMTRSFDDTKAELRPRLALDRATDLVYDRANKVQDALAGGAKLDQLPGDLGLAAVAGTLDADGKTADGTPAPIPGTPALRAALVAHAFQIASNDAPTLENGPDHSFYAVTVESMTPPQQKPLSAVMDRVKDDWLRATRRHEQDVIAARLLAAVKGGATLAAAAAKEGLTMQHGGPIARSTPPAGLPRELVQPVFMTPKGQPAMVEAAEGFWVAVPTDIQRPDPAADPAAVDRLRLQLSGSVGDDIEMTYASSLQETEKVTVNNRLLDSVNQP